MTDRLSISRAWDEARTILARDGKLLATVAAALLVLPGIVRDVLTPAAEPGKLPEPGAWMLVWLLATLVALVGQLAITYIALARRTTVGEAITHSAKRMPVYLAGQILWVLPFAIIFLGLTPFMQPPSPSAAAAILSLVLFAVFIFVAVRLLLTPAVAVEEPVGPIAMIRRSWALTSGNWWRLFGFLVLFIIGAAILVLATMAVFGMIARLLLGGIEPLSVGALLVSLAGEVVTAAVYLLLMTMLARIYVQLAGDPSADVSVPSSGT